MKSFGWSVVFFVGIVLLFLIYVNERGTDGLKNSLKTLTEAGQLFVDLRTGKVELQKGTIVSFWTPSAETASYWREIEDKGESVPAKDTWEKSIDATAIQEFYARLTTVDGFQGFRRYPVWGRGETTLKPGYWWVVRFDKNLNFTKLTAEYQRMCNCSRAYFEFLKQYDARYALLSDPGGIP